MITFKQFFTESFDKAIKLTSPRSVYNVKYLDGNSESYRLNEFEPTQSIEYVFVDDKNFLHSPDNNTPAIVEYDNHLSENTKTWFKHGLSHREGDLPSFIREKTFVDPNRFDVLTEIWHKNGLRHRLTGPAVISYDNGEVYSEEYFINGQQYSKEDFDEYIKGLDSKEDREMLGDLGQTFE